MHRNYFLPFLGLAFLLCCSALPNREIEGVFDTCRQLVVVVSTNPSNVKAKLFKYEKKGKKWRQVGKAHPVNLGRKGLAWGRGVQSQKPGLQKKEGDLRSPAGIFRFGTAFGYAAAGTLSLKLPYLPITEAQICIEDSNSPFYNQLVDALQLQQDWVAKENMMRDDEQYKWGIFVNHNVPAEPECGSCIFFHLWKKPGSGTLGCTAMAEDDLLSLMQWLDPAKMPLLMQMTNTHYEDYRRKFALPVLN
ncbi:MAG: L,D-transpeptidase [Saprospiraceae bacterium]